MAFVTVPLLFNMNATIIYYEIQGYGSNRMSEEPVSVHVQIIMRCFCYWILSIQSPVLYPAQLTLCI